MMLSTNILIFVCLVAARTLAKEDILCTCASEDAGACLTPDACRCEDFHKCHITMEAAFMTGVGSMHLSCVVWCVCHLTYLTHSHHSPHSPNSPHCVGMPWV
eukprot:GHVN01024975.1.p1 GENE.GHVN01024975.1~~GHVN01024975.1.p1  ORF type:complete len:102 (+),score=28.50 GHVN01024975.1:74-379(+)